MSRTRPSDIAFPESVVAMLRGDLGQPPGGWPQALQKKVLKGEQADHRAAGLAAADRRSRRRAQPRSRSKLRAQASTNEFASYLMYPKVFADFAAAQDTYGPVAVLPTPVYLLRHGSRRRDHRRHRARQDAGRALPGASARPTRRAGHACSSSSTASRASSRCRTAPQVGASAPPARKAEPGNDAHVGAPMPGVDLDASPSRPARRSRPATCC